MFRFCAIGRVMESTRWLCNELATQPECDRTFKQGKPGWPWVQTYRWWNMDGWTNMHNLHFKLQSSSATVVPVSPQLRHLTSCRREVEGKFYNWFNWALFFLCFNPQKMWQTLKPDASALRTLFSSQDGCWVTATDWPTASRWPVKSRGGGDSSVAMGGHLWNRLTNVSLLCHKDTRLTKPAINVPFYYTFICHAGVYPRSASCTVLPAMTRPWAIASNVLHRRAAHEGPSGMVDHLGRILMGLPPPQQQRLGIKAAFIYIQALLHPKRGSELLHKHPSCHLIVFLIGIKKKTKLPRRKKSSVCVCVCLCVPVCVCPPPSRW